MQAVEAVEIHGVTKLEGAHVARPSPSYAVSGRCHGTHRITITKAPGRRRHSFARRTLQMLSIALLCLSAKAQGHTQKGSFRPI